MIVKMLLIDACTDGLFSGGTAAVAFLRHLGQEIFLEGLAEELGFPVTAYVLPHQDEFITRSFSPRNGEIDAHSFAALAVAHAIYGAGLAPADKPVTLHGRGGSLRLFKKQAPYPEGAIGLHLDAAKTAAALPEVLARFQDRLNLTAADVLKAEYLGANHRLIYCRATFAMESLDAQRLREAFPQTALTFSTPLSAPGAPGYLVRAFSAETLPEYVPMTLAIHSALGPFWAAQLKAQRLEVHYFSPRNPRLWIDQGAEGLTLSAQVNTVFRADPVMKELKGDAASDMIF
jgi:predicted PhzF superfamily epimerase YddE/YHI9